MKISNLTTGLSIYYKYTLEGPEVAKWELGFAHILAGKMGFHALGLGFINKKNNRKWEWD